MAHNFTFSPQQAQNLMNLLNLSGPVQVTQVRQYNHTYRILCQNQAFYLKVHTKDWYPPDEGKTGYSVRHETSAWKILARHGLATPEVVLAGQDDQNPPGHAYILTREVPGTILGDVLARTSLQETAEILRSVGIYLRNMHAIQFPYAGYIIDDGPSAPPGQDYWQHFTWTLQARQHSLYEWLQGKQKELTPSLFSQLEEMAQQVPAILASAYASPRFTQGDCWVDQIMMVQQSGSWHISAFLDMEVASAGDCTSDLVSLCNGLAQILPSSAHWWQALFEGYGTEPDFTGFRLRLLSGWYPYETHLWPGAGEKAFQHILQAKDWETLFAGTHLS